jgi:hypothetical protein
MLVYPANVEFQQLHERRKQIMFIFRFHARGHRSAKEED